MTESANNNLHGVPLYRAVPLSQADVHRKYTRHSSPRAPSNIPYVVDNLWEMLRPEHRPSRRHAFYASPTPELALKNASAPTGGQEYVVCELEVHGKVRIAQIPQEDARYHPDVRALREMVMKTLSDERLDWADFATRQAFGPLFMPWLKPEELRNVLAPQLPLVQRIIAQAEEISTFWQDSLSFVMRKPAHIRRGFSAAEGILTLKVDASAPADHKFGKGELFLELEPLTPQELQAGAQEPYYTLKPVELKE